MTTSMNSVPALAVSAVMGVVVAVLLWQSYHPKGAMRVRRRHRDMRRSNERRRAMSRRWED